MPGQPKHKELLLWKETGTKQCLRFRIVNCTLTWKTTSCHTAVTFVLRIDQNINVSWEIMIIINSVCLVSVHNSSITLYPGFSWVQIQITSISPLYRSISHMTLWKSLDHFAHEWKHKGKCKAHRLWSFWHPSTMLFQTSKVNFFFMIRLLTVCTAEINILLSTQIKAARFFSLNW